MTFQLYLERKTALPQLYLQPWCPLNTEAKDILPLFKGCMESECKHVTHSSSWRAHWDWECLSDIIKCGTLHQFKQY